MFKDFFEYCTFDNPVFLSGLFWGVVFLITITRVIHFKLLEAKEKAIEDEIIEKYIKEKNLKRSPQTNRIEKQSPEEVSSPQIKPTRLAGKDRAINEAKNEIV